MGFDGILAEGADHVLGYRSPNFLYSRPLPTSIKLLLKNYRLSDDIAFRFGNRDWTEWPLTAEKFASWVNQINGNGYVVQPVHGLRDLRRAPVGRHGHLRLPATTCPASPEATRTTTFLTVSQAVDRYDAVGELDVPHMISWADTERDLSAWLGNAMQSNALHELYALRRAVKATGDTHLIARLAALQTSDHFYYMCTKYFADGDVHKYFNPYESPYDSYINFMNAYHDLKFRLSEKGVAVEASTKLSSL